MFLTHLVHPSPIDSHEPPPNELLALRGLEAVLVTASSNDGGVATAEVEVRVVQSKSKSKAE